MTEMLLILLLCVTVQSSPMKYNPLESDLSKASIAESNLLTLLQNAQKLPQDSSKDKEVIPLNKHNDGKLIVDLNNQDTNKETVKLAFDDKTMELLRQLTKILTEVNENLSKQNKRIKQTKSKALYVLKVNGDRRYSRKKRETTDETEKNDLKVVNDNKITPADVESSTDTPVDNKDEGKSSANDISVKTNATEVSNCNQTINSRRSFDAANAVSKSVKDKLLSYINEYFNDLNTKMNSLREVKRALGTSDEYSIGYIVANIDTLGINLHDLRLDIELNHEGWSEKQILDTFDKIKTSHSVVASLIGALKSIMDRRPDKYSSLHLVK